MNQMIVNKYEFNLFKENDYDFKLISTNQLFSFLCLICIRTLTGLHVILLTTYRACLPYSTLRSCIINNSNTLVLSINIRFWVRFSSFNTALFNIVRFLVVVVGNSCWVCLKCIIKSSLARKGLSLLHK